MQPQTKIVIYSQLYKLSLNQLQIRFRFVNKILKWNCKATFNMCHSKLVFNQVWKYSVTKLAKNLTHLKSLFKMNLI